MRWWWPCRWLPVGWMDRWREVAGRGRRRAGGWIGGDPEEDVVDWWRRRDSEDGTALLKIRVRLILIAVG